MGGAASPLDALALLIEMLTITDTMKYPKGIADAKVDIDGAETIRLLQNAGKILRRISGNEGGSLGLHPAVYFYNEKGKHSRFLFLGLVELVAGKVHSNDKIFFQRFTKARRSLERFLIEYKGTIGLLLQNMGKTDRVPKMRQLFDYLINEFAEGKVIEIEQALQQVGARGRVLEITMTAGPTNFSDDTKSAIFVRDAIACALKCQICGGLIDPTKSVSYDHVVPRREQGLGVAENGQLVHPFCNQAVKQ